MKTFPAVVDWISMDSKPEDKVWGIASPSAWQKYWSCVVTQEFSDQQLSGAL